MLKTVLDKELSILSRAWVVTPDNTFYNLMVMWYVNNGLKNAINAAAAASLVEAVYDDCIVSNSSSTNTIFFL